MMTQLPGRNSRLRNAARAVKGALGRFVEKIVIVSPVANDLPPEDWPKFPPF
jgi:hypothetical protein